MIYCIVEREIDSNFFIYYITFSGCPLEGNETTVYQHSNLEHIDIKLSDFQENNMLKKH